MDARMTGRSTAPNLNPFSWSVYPSPNLKGWVEINIGNQITLIPADQAGRIAEGLIIAAAYVRKEIA